MIRVYTDRTIASASNVKNVLEANGIACILRNEFLSAGTGEIPPIECWPEVWVTDDGDAERAQKLIAEATEDDGADGEPWRCRHCGEEVDAVFGQCWNCSAERPAESDVTPAHDPQRLRGAGTPRPWWMTALFVACFATLVATVGGELTYQPARDVEVWLGFELTGALARLTAPLHWAIFAAGAFAFWKNDLRAVPWAAAYLVYVGVSHLVWSEMSPHGRGWPIGLLQAAAFSSVGVVLLRAYRSERTRRSSHTVPQQSATPPTT